MPAISPRPRPDNHGTDAPGGRRAARRSNTGQRAGPGAPGQKHRSAQNLKRERRAARSLPDQIANKGPAEGTPGGGLCVKCCIKDTEIE